MSTLVAYDDAALMNEEDKYRHGVDCFMVVDQIKLNKKKREEEEERAETKKEEKKKEETKEEKQLHVWYAYTATIIDFVYVSEEAVTCAIIVLLFFSEMVSEVVFAILSSFTRFTVFVVECMAVATEIVATEMVLMAKKDEEKMKKMKKMKKTQKKMKKMKKMTMMRARKKKEEEEAKYFLWCFLACKFVALFLFVLFLFLFVLYLFIGLHHIYTS